MKKILRIGCAALITIALCASALAQGRGAQPGHMANSGHPRGPIIFGNGQFTAPFGSFNSFRVGRVMGFAPGSGFDTLRLAGFPVPGLGFDFTHLAAIDRNFAARAAIDPATQSQIGLAQRFLRGTLVFPAGAPFIAPSSAVVFLEQSSPPVIIVQAPGADQVEDRPRPVRRVEQETVRVEPAAPPVPPRELSEYVLVRRDGAVVFAIGVMTQAGQVVYITREGIRRSLPLTDLDMDTTLRMNEERGISLKLAD